MPLNDNLEAMAKQLYDYWFVQFDFPNEDGKPYKSSGGAMVWNEKLKREIPQGWKVLSVNDIATNVRGVSYTKDDLVSSDRGVLVLRGNNIQDNRLIYDSNVAYIPKSFVSKDQHIHPLDIIMTMSSGSKEHIGKCAMFQLGSEDTFGAFLTKFTAKEHCAFMLFNLFNSQYFKAKIKSIACGTGINNLTNQTFDEIYMTIPQDNLLFEFDKKQAQIFAEIGLIEKNNLELTKQRDELLPLLMNGQASVNYHLSMSFHRPPHPHTFALKTTILCPTIQTTHSPCEPFRGLGLRRRSRRRRARCSRKNTRWRRCGSTTGCSMCLGARTTKCLLISLTLWRVMRRSPLVRCSMPRCAMAADWCTMQAPPPHKCRGRWTTSSPTTTWRVISSARAKTSSTSGLP